ncbi:KipI antagonist [Luteitalea pratensis]|uniref:KipI antagonist n=1 Tax=Luteitalea pratensis TaxID=1855912 RepID=A0A143PSY8_LUTPR|nr:biotin-dependent carboxyltransferase family protein [Luteitalea pratensis]AMY10959.1 KipI antagonist [Luteitalea pratensis]
MSAPGLTLVRAGLHTTVQDAGRWGHQHLGVPVGGALDLDALRRANTLVGNAPGEAALEVTLVGCALRAEVPMHAAVTGATFDLDVHGRPMAADSAIALAAGDLLTLGERRGGARACVAVRGGIDTPLVLGSRSAWPLDTRRGALTDGSRLAIGSRVAGPVRPGRLPGSPRTNVLRVVAGPDAPVAADALVIMCTNTYMITAGASRMAYPLDGAPMHLLMPDRPSSGTVTGAIQVLPSGLPMLLMAERQTTGGYPVVAIVITADVGQAAQLAPADDVRFELVSHADAVRALFEQDARAREIA